MVSQIYFKSKHLGHSWVFTEFNPIHHTFYFSSLLSEMHFQSLSLLEYRHNESREGLWFSCSSFYPQSQQQYLTNNK